MFSALIKAFTGRAGFLPGLLALMLIALTAAAVLLNLPRIEQKLIESSQTVLQQNLGENDQLHSVQAEGRNILIEGDFEDVASLVAQLNQIDGVRGVRVTASERTLTDERSDLQVDALSDVTENSEIAVAEETPVVAAEPNTETQTDLTVGVISQDASASAEDQPEVEAAAADQNEVAESMVEAGEPRLDSTTENSSEADLSEADATENIDQSSLVLRYDGTRLVLSGHLANEEMVELISIEVSNAVPAQSELEVLVDSSGTPSSLNWMNEFLQAVSGLPEDAQGVIQGSDSSGVDIIPDAQQTLRVQNEVAENESAAEPENGQQETPDIPMPEAEAPSLVDQDVQLEETLPSTSEPSITKEAAQPVDGTEHSQDSAQNGVNPAAEMNIEMNAESAANVDISMEQVDSGPVPALPKSETVSNMPPPMHPAEFIDGLNQRIAEQPMFEVGQYDISNNFAAELDALARVMVQNPRLLLRVVGNLDFEVDRRDARFVGIDRAREIRDYITAQRVEPFRVFAAPLPRNYAFDKRVQVIFYITE